MSSYTDKYVSSARVSPLTSVVRAATTSAALSSEAGSAAVRRAVEAGASPSQAMAHQTNQFLSSLSSQGSFFETITSRGDPSRIAPPGVSSLPSAVMGEKRGQLLGSNDIMYPSDTSMPYKFRLAIMEYERPTPIKTATLPRVGNIYLPIPPNLSEEFGIDTSNMNTGLAGMVANHVDTALSQGDANRITAGAGEILTTSGYVTSFEMARSLGLESVAGLAGQAFGLVPNPHTTVFFNGVNLRQFQFSWRLAPENQRDAIQLEKLINSLKKYTLPQYGGNKDSVGISTLQYPHIFEPSFIGPDGSDILYKFKKCLCTHIGVNYAPTGNPAFFKDSKPVSVVLSLQLTELEIFTSEDFGGASGQRASQIGSKFASAARGAGDAIKNALSNARTELEGRE